MSSEEKGKSLGKVPEFRLKGASGHDFETAFRRAEADLQAPIPTFRSHEVEPPEAEVVEEGEPDTVHLQLTLKDGAMLVSEFSGAHSLKAATPAEIAGDHQETADFQEVPRSGAEHAARTYEDWLAPMDPDDWSADAPVGGLTAEPAAPLLSDFSGAETMPPVPEEEEPAFVNDGLPSLTATEGKLLSEFSGSNLFGDADKEEPQVGGMSALDDIIFSSDPRASEPPLPKVTGRTEPEFLFKR